MEQRTMEWFVARMGNITSSNVGKLMGKGRSKENIFSQTGYTYLNSLIAENLLLDEIRTDETAFEGWKQRCEGGGYATIWGEKNEDDARLLYSKTLQCGEVEEVGFVEHPAIKRYGDSSDGVIYNGLLKVGVLEIKCPYSPANTIAYVMAMNSLEDKAQALKEENPEYYWQCVSHCECHKVDWCDLVIYDPMVKGNLWVYRIIPPQEDIDLLKERVSLAVDYLNAHNSI